MAKTRTKNNRGKGRRNRTVVQGSEKHPPTVATMLMGGRISYGFPHQLLTRVRYHDFLTVTSTAGSLGKYIFRWNSTFDPDLTSTGHQPLYRDTFASIYDQYAVVSASAAIKFVNTTADAWLCGVVSEDDSSASSSVSVLCEQATGLHTLLPPQTGALSTCVFNPTFDCVKFLGIDPYTSQSYKTAVGSNPTEEADLVIWGVDAAGGTTTLFFDIEMEMLVLWSELTTPTVS